MTFLMTYYAIINNFAVSFFSLTCLVVIESHCCHPDVLAILILLAVWQQRHVFMKSLISQATGLLNSVRLFFFFLKMNLSVLYCTTCSFHIFSVFAVCVCTLSVRFTKRKLMQSIQQPSKNSPHYGHDVQRVHFVINKVVLYSIQVCHWCFSVKG